MPGPWTGEVQITVLDGQAGTVTAPSQTVMAVIGCAIAGTNYQVVPTKSLATLASTFTGGPMVEAAGLVVQAGGVVLAVKTAVGTAGVITGSNQSATNVSGVSIVATNARVTYVAQTPHVLQTGDVVTIASVTGSTEVNGTWPITVIDATHFEIPVTSITPYVSGGTVQYTGAVATIASATATTAPAPYFTGTPADDYYPMVVAQTGFTVGTTGGSVLISLDAGRTFGPPIAVGTATTIALKDTGGLDTGLTLHLGGSGKVWAGGGVGSNGTPVGDYVRCSTVAPQPNDSGIASALAALVTYVSSSASVFPLIQIVGSLGASDATSIESGGSTNLDGMAAQYLFERAIMSSRDAHAPTAWGGQGETEATWEASVISDFASTVAKRVCATAGYYNMPTAFPTAFASSPRYRRPLSFALCAREVAIAPQRHAGKVGGTQGGPLSQIVVSPTRDPQDGFIYHDEYLSPAFDYFLPGGVARLAAARTHPRKAGIFSADPLTLAAQGSDFSLLPRAIVMDVACTLVQQALADFIAADFTTKPNGTLSDVGASTIYNAAYNALQSGMVAVGMISSFAVQVDQTQNILVTSKVTVTITILGVGYVLEEDVTIGFANALAASAA